MLCLKTPKTRGVKVGDPAGRRGAKKSGFPGVGVFDPVPVPALELPTDWLTNKLQFITAVTLRLMKLHGMLTQHASNKFNHVSVTAPN